MNKSKTKSQLQEEKLEKLSKPKDRLRLGKQLLKLKSMFPCDKTLQKMIYHEFTGTRLVKYANEYDVFDSDEEDLRKGCYEKDPKKENGFLVYEDLDRPQKERGSHTKKKKKKNIIILFYFTKKKSKCPSFLKRNSTNISRRTKK